MKVVVTDHNSQGQCDQRRLNTIYTWQYQDWQWRLPPLLALASAVSRAASADVRLADATKADGLLALAGACASFRAHKRGRHAVGERGAHGLRDPASSNALDADCDHGGPD